MFPLDIAAAGNLGAFHICFLNQFLELYNFQARSPKFCWPGVARQICVDQNSAELGAMALNIQEDPFAKIAAVMSGREGQERE